MNVRKLSDKAGLTPPFDWLEDPCSAASVIPTGGGGPEHCAGWGWFQHLPLWPLDLSEWESRHLQARGDLS